MNDLKRILIVDDEADFTLVTALTLQGTGKYHTHEVNNATAALTAARDFKPDLILLDVMMPGMDGGDVVTQLKDDQSTCHIPVVFLTALVAGDDTSVRSPAPGSRRFLPKPVALSDLTACIDETIASTANHPEAALAH